MIDTWQLDSPTLSPPHGGQPVLVWGEPLATAQAALILLHGRGATAQSILTVAEQLMPLGPAPLRARRTWPVVAVAPQAAGQTWYPYSFLAPLQRNEPWLSSALKVPAALLSHLEEAGIPASRTIVAGFSQGACLALEFVARNARRYGGVAGFSGGLIGPPGTVQSRAGALDGTPVFLGCSEDDPHIPAGRVVETAEMLGGMGGLVTMRLYPDLGHTINDDEIELVRSMLSALVQPA